MDTNAGDVRYFTMYGHNFGLKSAVLSFNRHSQLMCWIARRWFGVRSAAQAISTMSTPASRPTQGGQARNSCMTSPRLWLPHSPPRRIRTSLQRTPFWACSPTSPTSSRVASRLSLSPAESGTPEDSVGYEVHPQLGQDVFRPDRYNLRRLSFIK